MTDKQIIIDKLKNDVACKENIINHLAEHNIKLQNQLKRKEQECERLKEEVSLLKESNSKLQQIEDVSSLEKCYLQQIDQLKAENEKYSLFIEKLCDYIGLESDSEEQAMRTLSDFARQMNKVRWVIDRYKQTLAEIKEIAEKAYDEFGNDVYGINPKQILQKISECEVE